MSRKSPGHVTDVTGCQHQRRTFLGPASGACRSCVRLLGTSFQYSLGLVHVPAGLAVILRFKRWLPPRSYVFFQVSGSCKSKLLISKPQCSRFELPCSGRRLRLGVPVAGENASSGRLYRLQ
ncbi:unnamed protein product [Durusdinium trenchii]|uniref:Uncharacterized protein n=1 Tax=Durusdinium trenchii TaxID=1381693 RepID=A0ABP0S336_9DINO